MWMVGLTLAFTISITLAQKAAKKVKDSTASTGSPLTVGQLGHSMSMHYCQLKSTLLLMDDRSGKLENSAMSKRFLDQLTSGQRRRYCCNGW
ncbi:hypothetical protein V6N11_022150 [Hibiscus sabdariffa]|uniref:Uncharacterized protein n=1 Tax=Hibiscus sabdariffa TaxID=183260 RepID=A0ABR2TIB2_9ROSI